MVILLTYFWNHLHTGHSDAGGIEFAEEGLLHGVFQLLVPEAEDDGAEEGSEDCVGGAHQGVSFQRLGTLGLEVDDRGKAIVHDHHGEVGRTRGEGFLAAHRPRWRHKRGGGEDSSPARQWHTPGLCPWPQWRRSHRPTSEEAAYGSQNSGSH